MYQKEQVRIPYDEYKAIGELMRAHLRTHEGQLRAMIAFGDLVTRGNTYDIDLLEVVEGWQGPSSVVFASSAELPLRGQLRLYLVTAEEFEQRDGMGGVLERNLMDRVREGYDIIYEDPPAYALDTLAHRKLRVTGGNPLDILVSGGMRLP